MGPLDPTVNFAKATVSAGYAAGVTSITLNAGGGARFPVVPFNAVWWNATDYSDPADDPTVEIVRVTNITGNVLTIVRAQEGTADSSHNTPGRAYKLIEGITSSQMDIISEAFALTPANMVWAGPASGAAAAPSFRALTSADIAAAGSQWSVQFNNSGSLDGNSDLIFDQTSGSLVYTYTPTVAPGASTYTEGQLTTFRPSFAGAGNVTAHYFDGNDSGQPGDVAGDWNAIYIDNVHSSAFHWDDVSALTAFFTLTGTGTVNSAELFYGTLEINSATPGLSGGATLSWLYGTVNNAAASIPRFNGNLTYLTNLAGDIALAICNEFYVENSDRITTASTCLIYPPYNTGGAATLGFSLGVEILTGGGPGTTNLVALYIADQSGQSTGINYNIWSVGAASVNNFEGQVLVGGTMQLGSAPRFNAGNSTGAGAALLGTNSPSAHLTAPYTWVDVLAADGTPCTMPIWEK